MEATAASNNWIVPPRNPRNGALRLFCFPHAGAGASVYRLWPDQVRAEVEVLRIQYPGREVRLREPCLTEIEPFLDELMPALHPWLDRPFAIFGHSLGAILGVNVCRRLRESGGPQPAHFFASGCRAPHLDHRPPIHELPQDEFLHELKHRYGGVPDELLAHPELLDLVLPIIRADLAVFCSHRPDPTATPFAFPITVLGGQSDAGVRQDELEAWHQHSEHSLEVETFPGNHFFVQSAFDAVIGEVNRRLEPFVAGHSL